MIWRIIKNPLTLYVVITMMATMYLSIMVVCSWLAGRWPMWQMAAAGAVWISLFSAGVFGTLYHAVRLLMQFIPPNSDTSQISVLTAKEYVDLKAWVSGYASVVNGKLVLPSTKGR